MLIDLRDQLKPCPFCGRKVDLASLQMGSGIGVTRMDIECTCGISFKIYADDVIYSKDGTPHQIGLTALDKWQKRSELADELPSAQPEIIRCKDCKFWEEYEQDKDFGYCGIILCYTNRIHYCSYGERSE